MGKCETINDPRPEIIHLGGDGDFSGVPTYLEQLCAALKEQAQFIIVSDCNAGGYDFTQEQQIELHEINGLKTGFSIRKFYRAFRALDRIIHECNPDLVWAHPHMSVVMLRLLMILRRLKGQPVPPFVITCHGLPFGKGHRGPVSVLSLMLERILLRYSPPHHLHFLSSEAAKYYARRVGARAFRRHHYSVMANCSNLGTLQARRRNENPTLLMVARAGYQKNHRAAAEILAALPEDFQLVLCGQGTDSPKMAHMFEAVQKGLSRRVRFLGSIRDIRPLLAQADLFLLPSHYEGMAIAALEACEAGLPVALSKIPGMAEIVSYHPMAIGIDLHTPAKSADGIIDLVQRFRRNPQTQRAIQAVWEKHFSYEQWALNARNLLSEILRNHKSR